MTRYRCAEKQYEQECMYRLDDFDTNSSADILPGFGTNVIGLCLHGREVILRPPSVQSLKDTPFRYGIPLLCPPGRTSRGKFEYNGRQYQFPVTHGEHHMHGEIGTLPWKVIDVGEDSEHGAFIHTQYRLVDDPMRFHYFPHHLEYNLIYSLVEGKLRLDGSVLNEGSDSAPFALGFHPYMCFTGEKENVKIRIPSHTEWPMNREGGIDGLPMRSDLADVLPEGIPLSRLPRALHFLQCTGAASSDESGAYVCEIQEEVTGEMIRLHMDSQFPVLALFVPAWGNAVSFEPHTCVPDAFNLHWDSSLTGARGIKPGEHIRFKWEIDVHGGDPI